MNYIREWLKIGNKNPWIAEAYDPPFTEKMFYECKTIEDLIRKFEYGNWCLGQAFYYKNLCFINQIDGGDEWLVIRNTLPFDSCSCGRWIEKEGKEDFIKNYLERILVATDEQLKKLEW